MNKTENNLKIVKFSEFEIGNKKYQESSFEFIRNKNGEKLTIILNNQFKLILPNRLVNLSKKRKRCPRH